MGGPLSAVQALPTAIPRRHIALFGPSFGEGGVARDIVNLANGFVRAGMEVSVLVNRPNELFMEQLYPKVRQVVLPSRSDRGLARELLGFIREHWPAVVMSTEERDDGIAAAVRDELKAPQVRFFLRMVTTLSVRLANQYQFRLNRALYRRKLRQIYSRCDGLICNSEGVADDLVSFLDLPRAGIAVLPNPTITPELLAAAREPVAHPWFAAGEPPVILGAGRLGRAKDFGTLIKAFALLRCNRPCRLMILGQGRQKDRLEGLARELGVAADFELPGFVTNPYAYMARAGLFVLSSLWEGCPNVLIEAMAVGTPVVATDCRSGPREILQGGRFGPLVPLRDSAAMAEAMAATLSHPLSPQLLRYAVQGYTLENSIRKHLEVFFPDWDGSAD